MEKLYRIESGMVTVSKPMAVSIPPSHAGKLTDPLTYTGQAYVGSNIPDTVEQAVEITSECSP